MSRFVSNLYPSLNCCVVVSPFLSSYASLDVVISLYLFSDGFSAFLACLYRVHPFILLSTRLASLCFSHYHRITLLYILVDAKTYRFLSTILYRCASSFCLSPSFFLLPLPFLYSQSDTFKREISRLVHLEPHEKADEATLLVKLQRLVSGRWQC